MLCLNTLFRPRFVINDTFRSSLCLIHPPHLIAIAAIYLAFSLHPPANTPITAPPTNPSDSGPSSRTRRHSTDAGVPSTAPTAPLPRAGPPPPGGQTDPITFLSTLNVDYTLVLEIVQEVISLYELWNALESSAAGTAVSVTGGGKGGRAGTAKTTTVGADEKVVGILQRMRVDRHKEQQSEKERGKGAPSWKKG